jgi:hypothetical protein
MKWESLNMKISAYIAAALAVAFAAFSFFAPNALDRNVMKAKDTSLSKIDPL